MHMVLYDTGNVRKDKDNKKHAKYLVTQSSIAHKDGLEKRMFTRFLSGG
jgi:hypothetical protein